jgi:hypothetical protein
MIYSELEDFDSDGQQMTTGSNGIQLPRVFSMRQGVELNSSELTSRPAHEEPRDRHYPPASDDPRQFTLLKFYELDAGAIKLLLSEQSEDADLPFTPGPKVS